MFSSGVKYSEVFHNLMLSCEAVATCFPSGNPIKHDITPDSVGVRNVLNKFGAVEVDDRLRSHISTVPFLLPASTCVPLPDQHAYLVSVILHI